MTRLQPTLLAAVAFCMVVAGCTGANSTTTATPSPSPTAGDPSAQEVRTYARESVGFASVRATERLEGPNVSRLYPRHELWVVRGRVNETTSGRVVVAFGPNGPLVLPRQVASLNKVAGVEPASKLAATRVARVYVRTVAAETRVLTSARDIPPGEDGDRARYTDIVTPPTATRTADGYRVSLYTWHATSGALVHWQVTTDSVQVDHEYDVLDRRVGNWSG